ncbi:error-prone DNA polymerase [Arcanobacterium wilhelmae]|uniref:Error-prone DNA polymerase n=1 Tax=Arcanobacterium wilhelmae TaxID=1803177 RepID=A0ABT9N8C5_9ACTO|nr:error-prone DNA polymerase [Arcanobacterium wilhelmae]MDP9799959.1 error-prone DNA polymerase [Arcanobacterium wilhelmae]WFN91093.1 error-prone DNA polymerase [Arcanobacterium wilhelmae]
MKYAELHTHSSYSFLDGASAPAELVERAAQLGLSAIALTDHDGFPGVVQFTHAAREYGVSTVIGTEVTFSQNAATLSPRRSGAIDPEGEHLVVLVRDADGYHSLSRVLSEGMLAGGTKGQSLIGIGDIANASAGQWQILTGCRKGRVRSALDSARGIWAMEEATRAVSELVGMFGRENVAVELISGFAPLDRDRNEALVAIAERENVRIVATNNVHSARSTGLSDALVAIRANRSLESAAPFLPSWKSVLMGDSQMRIIHRDHESSVDMAGEIGAECAFDFALVAPDLPPFPVPAGESEASWLRKLVEEKATRRYGTRAQNPSAWKVIDHEMQVIEQCHFPGYFLIVHEIVQFCEENGIWCQGRGSAANSAICYALGITAVDAVRHHMLFERFLSPGRSGPPDIDLDIEAKRREEVIQHVYARYGRECSAQVANVITYRPKSAIRDAARALGYEVGAADRWAKMRGRSGEVRGIEHEIPKDVVALAQQLERLPRHLGIHSGGMVLCDRPVIEVCPVGWATKPGRTVLQWDKDDCADAGLVKFDLLGLGMLTALRLAFTPLRESGVTGTDGRPINLHNLPQDDQRVYDLLCAADTVGVFQVESRAQMATLPRLQPRTFYDLVIEVALIRPGPIQGNSVNPYINRRRGREPVTYEHPLLKNALEKTLGVPLFQEQLMQIAIDVAGFTPGQADQLRKAMGSKRSHERMLRLRSQLMDGMAKNGISRVTSERIYEKLEAFADFGFPESHSFSFAYLVYASAWLKVHHPEGFYAGILAAQPMGFYSVQTLIADARRHGVSVLEPDVNFSAAHSQVEKCERRVVAQHALVDASPVLGVRLGLTNVTGLGKAIERIISARLSGKFESISDLALRAELTERELMLLAQAGALKSLGISRREGIWAAGATAFQAVRHGNEVQPTIPGLEFGARAPKLPRMSRIEELRADVKSLGASVHHHPVEFVRALLAPEVLRISDVAGVDNGTRIKVAGMITHRQRPHTASGITFVNLEDETGLLNVLCSAGMWRHFSREWNESAVVVRGVVEKADGVVTLVADGVEKCAVSVSLPSRDFR